MSGSSVPSFAKWSTRSLDDHGMQPASTWGNWEFLLLVENSVAQQYQLGRFVFIKKCYQFCVDMGWDQQGCWPHREMRIWPIPIMAIFDFSNFHRYWTIGT